MLAHTHGQGKISVRVAQVLGLRGDLYCEIRIRDTTMFGKTPVVCGDNPSWMNNAYEFSVRKDQILQIKVYNKTVLINNELLGTVEVPVMSLVGTTHVDAIWRMSEDAFNKQLTYGQIRLVVDSAGFLDNVYVQPTAFQLPPPGTSLLVSVVAAKVGKKDIFVEVRLKDTTAVGKTFVSRDHNPTWDSQFKFKPDNWGRDVVLFKMYRDDIMGSSLYGCLEVPTSTLLGRGHIDQWFETFDDQYCRKKNGFSLHIKMTIGEQHPMVAPVVQVQVPVPVQVQVPVAQPMAYPPQPQYSAPPPYLPQSQPQVQVQVQIQPQPQYTQQQPQPYGQPTPSAPYTGPYEGLYPAIPSTNPQVQQVPLPYSPQPVRQ